MFTVPYKQHCCLFVFFLQSGTTLLMIAAYKGLTEVVSMLLDYGAGIDMRNEVGSFNTTLTSCILLIFIAEWFVSTNACL